MMCTPTPTRASVVALQVGNAQDDTSVGHLRSHLMEWAEDDLNRYDVLPAIVRRALAEVDGCMKGGAYAMATVAARRGLEALCRDKGATRGTLQSRLLELKNTGIIDGRLADWATHLRNIGNEGAHDLDFEPDREEAADSRALLEGMVRHVYIDQARYEEAKRRWEYRRLPPIDVHYDLTRYSTGCMALTVYKPQSALVAGENDRQEIGTWAQHWYGTPSERRPDLAEANHESWAHAHRATAIWLEARGHRLGEWTKAATVTTPNPCPDNSHPPF